MSCLGVAWRLTGQNRSPRPPAMMIANRSWLPRLLLGVIALSLPVGRPRASSPPG